MIIAIDPGSERSALVGLATGLPRWHELIDNGAALKLLDGFDRSGCTLVIESTKPYAINTKRGPMFPSQIYDTAVWVGRYVERWSSGAHLIDRRQVKLHMLGRASGTDAEIRDSLLDRYGGREAAIGSKANPGPLRGMTQDRWQALALAVMFAETRMNVHAPAPVLNDVVPF